MENIVILIKIKKNNNHTKHKPFYREKNYLSTVLLNGIQKIADKMKKKSR